MIIKGVSLTEATVNKKVAKIFVLMTGLEMEAASKSVTFKNVCMMMETATAYLNVIEMKK